MPTSSGIPDLAISLGYAVGYLPVMVGFAELADNRLRVRRLSSFIDGLLLFLVIYGVIWLLVVEQVAFDDSLTRLDRAFMSLYPAGDLALVMLAVRIATSRSLRRRVVGLLIAGSVLLTVADVWLLVGYLHEPYGEFPITDALYLTGLACVGTRRGVEPAAVATTGRHGRRYHGAGCRWWWPLQPWCRRSCCSVS